jgi:hypothetical protein
MASNNNERALDAHNARTAYLYSKGEPLALSDDGAEIAYLISDLMHLADKEGHNFTDILKCAQYHYEGEKVE